MSAERDLKIQSYGAAHERLMAALQRFPVEMWQFRPAPDRWTIHEIIIHIADSEANSYVRCRRLIAQPGSEVLGYDENKWARDLHYHERNTADALELFRWLRRNSYELIRHLPESVWAHTVQHSEDGLVSMESWLQTYDWHITAHIEQMQAVYDDWLRQQDAA